MHDPFGVWQDFSIGRQSAGRMVSLRRFEAAGCGEVSRLPASLRIILESVLRNLGQAGISQAHAHHIAGWRPDAARHHEVPFRVARVLLQDISGIPVLMDVNAMRQAMRRRGLDPEAVQPAVPVDLVVDHSIQVDKAGSADALDFNTRLEFSRNRERYAFLKWGAQAFRNLRVLPPGSGIVHQVNLEYLARGLLEQDGVWFLDTLLGTDSHTTMANALGIVGWGVGGIEAIAAILGEPVSLLLPDVVGVRLGGKLREGVTATDLVLTLTQILRRQKVVGQFVEFYGEGARLLSVPDRATISNMAPEFGASLAYFPADERTHAYYLATGRKRREIDRWRAYLEQQDLFGIADAAECSYSRELALDLGEVEPCIAGPSTPQQRLRLADVPAAIRQTRVAGSVAPPPEEKEQAQALVRDGDILIAAITSCTNTSNPALMLAAGLLAQKAVRRGLRVDPKVKTSLAPGSRAVASYLDRAGLREPLERLGFHVVGYGCTTCMGGSGALAAELEDALATGSLTAVAVLSGNRNFEARIHPRIRANFLMSPPLVVAYALAGNIGVDLTSEPLAHDGSGVPVHLKHLWPSSDEIAAAMAAAEDPAIYTAAYRSLDTASPLWKQLDAATGPTFQGDPVSSYVRGPPFLDGFEIAPQPMPPIRAARALAILGASVTTDHISPVGRIAAGSPAGAYLSRSGIAPADFNTYGARRGNHEVMVRGMFSNGRLGNKMVGREGGFTIHHPSRETVTIYEAATRYLAAGVPTLIFAGDEYGTGSSRDWAAKGLTLLGVRAVIAEGFERIHRSNLVGMGVLPCQLQPGMGIDTLALSGSETFDVATDDAISARQAGTLVIHRANGVTDAVAMTIRVDTAIEAEYVCHGGILPYLLRGQLAAAARRTPAGIAARRGRGRAVE